MSTLNDLHHDQFLRLFAEHEAALRTFVRSMVPSLADASEIMQDTAVVPWRKFDEFDDTPDFRKWAFGVVRYQALTHLRDRVRDRHLLDNALVNSLADDAAAANQRHEAQREALDHCLQELSDARREMVLKAYMKGTQMDKLAAERGQTAMSLYKMLHRIRSAG